MALFVGAVYRREQVKTHLKLCTLISKQKGNKRKVPPTNNYFLFENLKNLYYTTVKSNGVKNTFKTVYINI